VAGNVAASGLGLLFGSNEMYVLPGYGLSCNPNDADSIATQLRWFLEHPVETREMGGRGRQRILSEWSYERQFNPVKKEIERLARN
jgi:hypothetical protein